MADREAQQKLYAYSEMSNKVQQADRSARRNRTEGTGEVDTLRGRSDIGRMGDRILSRSEVEKRPAELEEMMERAKKKRQTREQNHHGAKENILLSSGGGQSILDIGELNKYQPTHPGSRSSYESLLVSQKRILLKLTSFKTWHDISHLSVHFFEPFF